MHLPHRDLAANLLELAETMETCRLVSDELHVGPRRSALLARLDYAIGEIQSELDEREAIATATLAALRS